MILTHNRMHSIKIRVLTSRICFGVRGRNQDGAYVTPRNLLLPFLKLNADFVSRCLQPHNNAQHGI
jgi:hypothetical protein